MNQRLRTGVFPVLDADRVQLVRGGERVHAGVRVCTQPPDEPSMTRKRQANGVACRPSQKKHPDETGTTDSTLHEQQPQHAKRAGAGSERRSKDEATVRCVLAAVADHWSMRSTPSTYRRTPSCNIEQQAHRGTKHREAEAS